MLPDIQVLKPNIPVKLNRVGVTGIKKIVEVDVRYRRPVILISIFDVFIDLPPNLKGANLSRSLEAVDEVLDSLTKKPVKRVEDLCMEIADELLKRHDYAERSEVRMRSELILTKKTPVTRQRTQEVISITCDAIKARNGYKKVFIGAELYGVTACPCGQELVKARIEEILKDLKRDELRRIIDSIPIATHNQRGKASIKIEVRDEFSPRIEDLIEIARSSMSSEMYELLKREDELEVIWKLHKNPRFVEDCVRIMAREVVKRFEKAPPDILVIFRQENEESIHQHNVIAERIATIEELRREMGGDV